MTTTAGPATTIPATRTAIDTSSQCVVDGDEDLETTPCGIEVVSSQYDSHVGGCEDCDAEALADEARGIAWAAFGRR